MFRKCNITKVYFKGTVEQWNANSEYVKVFGEALHAPDSNGAYTLSYSQYAQDMAAELENSEKYPNMTSNNKSDVFVNNSRDGLIKLYLVNE